MEENGGVAAGWMVGNAWRDDCQANGEFGEGKTPQGVAHFVKDFIKIDSVHKYIDRNFNPSRILLRHLSGINREVIVFGG